MFARYFSLHHKPSTGAIKKKKENKTGHRPLKTAEANFPHA